MTIATVPYISFSLTLFTSLSFTIINFITILHLHHTIMAPLLSFISLWYQVYFIMDP